MAEKESGDSEKKMTKDFLDRWKKISQKYEGPEEEKAGQEKKPEAKLPRSAEQDLDAFLADMGEKGEPAPAKGAAKRDEGKDLDQLLEEFGLSKDETRLPKKSAEVPRPAPAPPPPSAEEQQRRVLETLKKVGLIGPGAPGHETPEPSPSDQEEVEEEQEQAFRLDHEIEFPKAAPAAQPEEMGEDELLLELEALLADQGVPERKEEAVKAEGPAPAGRPEAFEEEDLLADLEGLLEGGGEIEEEEEAKPAPKPVGPLVVKEAFPAATIAPARLAAPPPIAPPPALKTRAAPERPRQKGRTNGGRVNGGRVNGGRVNGGRVNGGRVNGGRVNGGRVNGGRVNGGRVNGGRVNGGRVNGGRVNGGRVNGGRVNGGRVNGRNIVLPALAAQSRRNRIITVAVGVFIMATMFVGLSLLVPFGGGPTGPAVDGNLGDWAGSGALIFSDPADGSLPPALDLREYAIRTEGASRLWFEARADGDLFSRTGSVPARADLLVVLIDTDGRSGTGYTYHDMGVDRVVELAGWSGGIKISAVKSFAGATAHDYAGFQPTGGLQVSVQGRQLEALITGLTDLSSDTRAAFELKGVDSAGLQRSDESQAPATVGHPGVSVTVTAVASGILVPGAATEFPMLHLRVANPSPTPVQVNAIRVGAAYSPAAPSPLVGATVWRDINQNDAIDGADAVVSTGTNLMAAQGTTLFSLSPPLAVLAGASDSLIVSASSVPQANGTSVTFSLASASDVSVSGNASILLVRGPTPSGKQPGAYLGSPPTAIAVDGITLDWAGKPESVDPASDVNNSRIDLTKLQGNVTSTQFAALVSFSGSPLGGAIVPLRLPSTLVLPSTGGGGGTPATPPPNPGTDVLWVMIESDNDSSTGYLLFGKGYDFAFRVDGKDGAVIPGGARLYRWDGPPSPGWTALSQAPQVGVGATSLEFGAPALALNLTARNVTVTAFATDWLGVRDDLSAPLILSNSQGSRGDLSFGMTQGATPGEETAWPPGALIPEFETIVAPLMGVLVLAMLTRSRARARRHTEE